MALCRHCQRKQISRPRGLCWTCFYDPAIREQFPVLTKFRRDISGAIARDFNGPGRPPSPTSALPGTPEKEAVLTQRAQNGETLFHPEDAIR